jgi:hypothetical protein
MTRCILVDGVDSLAIDPRATAGQPDGWGWDWERWIHARHGKPASAGAKGGRA